MNTPCADGAGMTNQTMRDCRAIVDGRVAVAEGVVTGQRSLIDGLRRQGRSTFAAEAALAKYRAVRVLSTPRAEQLRRTYDTLCFFASGTSLHPFVPEIASIPEAVELARTSG
jgi:hypothetical protein